jgi:DNA-binding transcriptional ArsR family regulator
MARREARRAVADRAAQFAAMGDPTRLALVGKLCNAPPRSIARLADGSTLTRQAITKHLRVLEGAGLVRGVRAGRESLFELRPEPLDAMRAYLDDVSRQWDNALTRLKSFVEK